MHQSSLLPPFLVQIKMNKWFGRINCIKHGNAWSGDACRKSKDEQLVQLWVEHNRGNEKEMKQ
jgi:hypothetical protein